MKLAKILLLVILPILLLFNSCNVLENETQSAVVLVLKNLYGGDVGEDLSAVICDVVDESVYPETVSMNVATVELFIRFLNPDLSDDQGTIYTSAVVDQIDIEYYRAGSLNTPGVDVPYPYSVKIYQLLEIGDDYEVAFPIVRSAAKLEPPLMNLRDTGNEKEMILIAKVTVWGKDILGNRLAPVSGEITIYCANYPDGSSGGDEEPGATGRK